MNGKCTSLLLTYKRYTNEKHIYIQMLQINKLMHSVIKKCWSTLRSQQKLEPYWELQSLPKVVGTLRTLDMIGVTFLLHNSF